ncbi:MAG: phage holin family protein [Rhodocyclaceae bacterium]|nr:phage holin family protein [Rhodocyclaceae bacterium]MDZ4216162.1 phage holin family protein [Rhodocyclaceae bacterium]
MIQSPRLLASLRGFATTSVALLRTRLALFKVEAQEEADRLIGMLLWGVAATLLCIAGLVFLAVWLTVLFWEDHRLLALGIFTAVFLGGTAFAVSSVLRLARQGSQLFAASLAELQRDEAALAESPHEHRP